MFLKSMASSKYSQPRSNFRTLDIETTAQASKYLLEHVSSVLGHLRGHTGRANDTSGGHEYTWRKCACFWSRTRPLSLKWSLIAVSLFMLFQIWLSLCTRFAPCSDFNLVRWTDWGVVIQLPTPNCFLLLDAHVQGCYESVHCQTFDSRTDALSLMQNLFTPCIFNDWKAPRRWCAKKAHNRTADWQLF